MTSDQYRARVFAQLDATRSAEKDRIILGFIYQLFPGGNPDHPVSGTDFIGEAILLPRPPTPPSGRFFPQAG